MRIQKTSRLEATDGNDGKREAHWSDVPSSVYTLTTALSRGWSKTRQIYMGLISFHQGSNVSKNSPDLNSVYHHHHHHHHVLGCFGCCSTAGGLVGYGDLTLWRIATVTECCVWDRPKHRSWSWSCRSGVVLWNTILTRSSSKWSWRTQQLFK